MVSPNGLSSGVHCYWVTVLRILLVGDCPQENIRCAQNHFQGTKWSDCPQEIGSGELNVTVLRSTLGVDCPQEKCNMCPDAFLKHQLE